MPTETERLNQHFRDKASELFTLKLNIRNFIESVEQDDVRVRYDKNSNLVTLKSESSTKSCTIRL